MGRKKKKSEEFYDNYELVEDDKLDNYSKDDAIDYKENDLDAATIVMDSRIINEAYEATKLKDSEEYEKSPDTVEKKEIPDKKQPEKKNKFYYGFGLRVATYIVAIIILSIITILIAYNSFTILDLEKIKYKEEGIIDYKVYLNKNDTYQTEYLDMNMVYIADLINYVKINMSYSYNISQKSNLLVDYQIMADLVIVDEETEKYNYYKNTYALSELKEAKIINNTSYETNEEISIDYWYYRDLADKFKKNYEVSTTSYLDVYMDVHLKSNENNPFRISNSNRASIRIPLSDDSVIMMINNIDREQRVSDMPVITLATPSQLIIAIFFGVITIIVLIKFLLLISKTIEKKSLYDRTVEKILKEYDEEIVDTTTPPNKDNKICTIVRSFDELLDAKHNVNEPIKYYVVTEHLKSEFYITHKNEIFIYTLKAVDLEKK